MNLTRNIYDQLVTAIKKFPGRKHTFQEMDDFIRDWWEQEEACRYDIGCPSFTDRPALLYAFCGMRELCGVNRRTALKFLRMAVADIEARHPNPVDLDDLIRGDVVSR